VPITIEIAANATTGARSCALSTPLGISNVFNVSMSPGAAAIGNRLATEPRTSSFTRRSGAERGLPLMDLSCRLRCPFLAKSKCVEFPSGKGHREDHREPETHGHAHGSHGRKSDEDAKGNIETRALLGRDRADEVDGPERHTDGEAHNTKPNRVLAPGRYVCHPI
jgi:hypothetical protein